MDDILAKTKQELLDEIAQGWAEINQFLDDLSQEQWTQVKNPDGWAVKDHVAHLSAWENSVIYLLTSKPRHEGLGVPEDIYLSHDFDKINDVIFQNHKDVPLEQVRSESQRIHADYVKHIEARSEEELKLPYRHFLPDEPGEGDGPPVVAFVYSDGAPHYREHQQWMEEQIKSN
jgi:hypothetical protein